MRRLPALQPPDYATFGNATQFATLRGFTIDASNRLADYDALLDRYTTGPAELGRVIWPMVRGPGAASVRPTSRQRRIHPPPTQYGRLTG